MVVAGKAELDKSNWLTTRHMKYAPKIKRACSNIFDLASVNSATGLIYTSTSITVITAYLYRITATIGTTGAIDIGVNGNDDSVVSAQAIATGNIDTLVGCAISSGSVTAGKMVTASVETAVGTSGTAIVCIEYTEDN